VVGLVRVDIVLLQMVSCVALMIQCYLVTEDENEKINSGETVFKLLVKLLNCSVRGRGYNGVNFAVIEIIEVRVHKVTTTANTARNAKLQLQLEIIPRLWVKLFCLWKSRQWKDFSLTHGDNSSSLLLHASATLFFKLLLPCLACMSYDFVPLAQVINKLAANDSNKGRIVRQGALPYYVKLLEPARSEREQAEAAHGLWTLAFKCKENIINEPGCLDGAH